MGNITLSDVLLVVLAIILPPVAVLIMTGCSWHLLLNIVLFILGKLADFKNVTLCLGWIPAVVHAFYLIAVRSSNRGGTVHT